MRWGTTVTLYLRIGGGISQGAVAASVVVMERTAEYPFRSPAPKFGRVRMFGIFSRRLFSRWRLDDPFESERERVGNRSHWTVCTFRPVTTRLATRHRRPKFSPTGLKCSEQGVDSPRNAESGLQTTGKIHLPRWLLRTSDVPESTQKCLK